MQHVLGNQVATCLACSLSRLLKTLKSSSIGPYQDRESPTMAIISFRQTVPSQLSIIHGMSSYVWGSKTPKPWFLSSFSRQHATLVARFASLTAFWGALCKRDWEMGVTSTGVRMKRSFEIYGCRGLPRLFWTCSFESNQILSTLDW